MLLLFPRVSACHHFYAGFLLVVGANNLAYYQRVKHIKDCMQLIEHIYKEYVRTYAPRPHVF